MDLAQATGTPESISLDGAEYPVRPLLLRELGTLQAWLKKAFPSPVTQAALAIKQARDAGAPLDPTTQDELLDHAQRAALAWPPRVGSKAWLNALEAADGGLQRLLYEILSKSDPAFTPERAEMLAPGLAVEEWLDLIHFALNGNHRVPKAGVPATAARPTAA